MNLEGCNHRPLTLAQVSVKCASHKCPLHYSQHACTGVYSQQDFVCVKMYVPVSGLGVCGGGVYGSE